MKKILLICLLLSGCAAVKDAHNEFRREVHGFNVEFARVFLNKEIENE